MKILERESEALMTPQYRYYFLGNAIELSPSHNLYEDGDFVSIVLGTNYTLTGEIFRPNGGGRVILKRIQVTEMLEFTKPNWLSKLLRISKPETKPIGVKKVWRMVEEEIINNPQYITRRVVE